MILLHNGAGTPCISRPQQGALWALVDVAVPVCLCCRLLCSAQACSFCQQGCMQLLASQAQADIVFEGRMAQASSCSTQARPRPASAELSKGPCWPLLIRVVDLPLWCGLLSGKPSRIVPNCRLAGHVLREASAASCSTKPCYHPCLAEPGKVSWRPLLVLGGCMVLCSGLVFIACASDHTAASQWQLGVCWLALSGVRGPSSILPHRSLSAFMLSRAWQGALSVSAGYR